MLLPNVFHANVGQKSVKVRKKAAMSWSSGKDSCYALHLLQESELYDFKFLLTTVTSQYDRVSIHGVREQLLERQSDSLGIPLLKVRIPPRCTNEIYESKMSEAIEKLCSEGVEYIGFGDIFLQDIREYRESKLKGTGIEPLFPLWGKNTDELASEILNAGIKAKITALEPSKVPKELAGEDYNNEFLSKLGETVDPCGENGEFHTFVYEAPFFKEYLKIVKGEVVERDGFVFADILPDRSSQ